MQCVSSLAPQPILPTQHHARLLSPKLFFRSSSPTTITVSSSFSCSKDNAEASFKRLPSPASAGATQALEALSDDDEQDADQFGFEEEGIVKYVAKPMLVLRFIWMEKNIGLGLDQLIPDYGKVPLSPYYFWPRKDAWEELKSKIEEKPWISQKRMIILLNQATDIINLWQQGSVNV